MGKPEELLTYMLIMTFTGILVCAYKKNYIEAWYMIVLMILVLSTSRSMGYL